MLTQRRKRCPTLKQNCVNGSPGLGCGGRWQYNVRLIKRLVNVGPPSAGHWPNTDPTLVERLLCIYEAIWVCTHWQPRDIKPSARTLLGQHRRRRPNTAPALGSYALKLLQRQVIFHVYYVQAHANAVPLLFLSWPNFPSVGPVDIFRLTDPPPPPIAVRVNVPWNVCLYC